MNRAQRRSLSRSFFTLGIILSAWAIFVFGGWAFTPDDMTDYMLFWFLLVPASAAFVAFTVGFYIRAGGKPD